MLFSSTLCRGLAALALAGLLTGSAVAYKMPMPDDVAAGTEADQQRWIENEMRDSSTLQQQVSIERGAERAAAKEQFATDQGMQAVERQKLMNRLRERSANEQATSEARQSTFFGGCLLALFAGLAVWWVRRRAEMRELAALSSGARPAVRFTTEPSVPRNA